MTEEYKQQLDNLAEMLVTPERFQEVQPVAELATVHTLYPDLPQVTAMYAPDSPEAA